MTKKTIVEKKFQTVNGKVPVSITTSSQDFKAACNIHACAAMRLFKHYLSSTVEPVMKTHINLPIETAVAQKIAEHCNRLS